MAGETRSAEVRCPGPGSCWKLEAVPPHHHVLALCIFTGGAGREARPFDPLTVPPDSQIGEGPWNLFTGDPRARSGGGAGKGKRTGLEGEM